MNTFFQKLTDFLENEVAPIANRLDEEEELYRDIYTRFVTLGGLKLLIPKHLGGLGGERREWIEFNILMARYSGALLFLQAQHQFSISRLKKLLPHPQVEEALQRIAEEGAGIGLALQKNPKLLKVIKVPEGYRLSGKFLWTTGLGYFSHLLVSFEDSGNLFYTLLPFQAVQQEGGSLVMLPKVETVVFDAIPNNSMILEHWLVTKSALLASHPTAPTAPIEHPTIYNFAGAAKALLDLVLKGRYGATVEVLEQHALLDHAWDTYYHHIVEGSYDPVALRSEGLDLAEQCALLARFSCGSAGILKSHDLGRVMREIWQYTIAGYSENQMKAYVSEGKALWSGKK